MTDSKIKNKKAGNKVMREASIKRNLSIFSTFFVILLFVILGPSLPSGHLQAQVTEGESSPPPPSENNLSPDSSASESDVSPSEESPSNEAQEADLQESSEDSLSVNPGSDIPETNLDSEKPSDETTPEKPSDETTPENPSDETALPDTTDETAPDVSPALLEGEAVTQQSILEDLAKEGILPEDLITNVHEDEPILEGHLLAENVPVGQFAEQAKIKLAEVNLEGKNEGDELTSDEALAALISLSTTEKDLEKTVLKSLLNENTQSLSTELLADEKTSETIKENTDKGFFESYQEKVGEAIANPEFQDKIAQDLEDDPDVEQILQVMVTPEVQANIVQKVIENTSETNNTDAQVQSAAKEVVQNNYNQFVLKEVVSQKLLKKQSSQNALLETLANDSTPDSQTAQSPLIKVKVNGPSGSFEIPMEKIHFESGSIEMLIEPGRDFLPGLHHAEIEIFNPITEETQTLHQDFLWGVLALNTDKDVYQTGEEGSMAIGVLDDQGRPVCDAVVTLSVTTPEGNQSNPEVKNTGNCQKLDSKNIDPDYQSTYNFSQSGEYLLTVKATLTTGEARTTTSRVSVEEDPAFMIERQAATRLYPVGEAPMTIKVHFLNDFSGNITEATPASFAISDIQSGGSLQQNEEENLITWEVKASAGEIKTLAYSYDAPDTSPEFYTVGPLRSSAGVQEKRVWQIANDEPVIEADSSSNLRINWQFNTGSGSTATDSSSNALNGTLTNMEAGDWITATPTTANQNPYALDFDGVNEYVTVADPASGVLDFNDTADFTITGWFNRDTFTTDDTLVSKSNGQLGTDTGYNLYIDDATDKLVLDLADGVDLYTVTSVSTFTTTGWHHFAVTWDENSASGIEIYIDGTANSAVKSGTLANIGTLANALAFRVGAEADAGNPFDGKVDDVRVYNKVLTSGEISILSGGNKPGGASNLALWLRADAGVTTSGADVTAWADQSGNGYSFTQGTVAKEPDKVSGSANFNPAINFDGTDDVLSTTTALPNPFDIYTVVQNTDTGSNQRVFFGTANSGGTNNYMSQKANNTSGQASSSFYIGGVEKTVATTNLDNEFFLHGGHLSGLSNGTVKLDINGKQIGTFTGGGAPYSVGDSSVGAGYSGASLTNYFLGDVAEVLVYSAAQTGTTKQKIESYLALKYGITIDQTAAGGGTAYLNSAGTTVWAPDTSDVFENDIAGIMQDDSSGLDQTKSKSVSSDEILAVGDATSQGNLDFMTWSNNNGSATWTSTGAPAGYKILSRQWQTLESTADIGTVDLEFDVADPDFDVPGIQGSTGYYFIYDSDDDGVLSDETPVLMKDDGTSGDDTASDSKWTRQQAFAADAGGGGATREFTIATFVDPVPTVTDRNISVNLGSGTANAFIVGDQVIVSWFNNLDGNTGLTGVTADLSGWGGSSTAPMTDTSACFGVAGNDVYEACYTLVSGTIDATNVNASVTASNLGGSTTAADTTNSTVDNQPPTVTASAISVTGATGTSGAFKSGDSPVGRWDNSGTGDNNTDTISSVSFNMANFKSGDTALTGSNSSNIWTTSLSGAMDSQGDTNNNTTVTVTDNAGNQTVTAGTNNYTVDNQLPTISSITSVAGDATAPYIDQTNDGNTAIIFTNSDVGTGVATCKWDASNVAYASMANTCATTTSCTSNLTGDGAKTVYLACIDGAGNAMTTNTQVDYTISDPLVTDPYISVNTGTGIANTFKVGDQVIATWDNSAAGDNEAGITSVTADLSGWGGSTTVTMTDTTACSGTAGNNIYEACYTLAAGTIDATNVNVSVTASNGSYSTTAADTTNSTVDNQPPTVTASAISVTGATGTSGAFKSGDSPVGRWDNSGTGDNNTDTISSVSFNMANFKSGDTALTGSNSSNIWTASLSGAMDSQGDTNNNTTVTVTDNAGNQTVTAGTNNYTVDNQLPTISSITSVAGDATAPYIDQTDNSNTPIIFVSADGGTGVSSCRFNPTDVAFGSMGFACASATNCTPFIAGQGAKTVYLSCIDGAGNTMASNTRVDYTIIDPLISDANISVNNGTGTSNAFKVGDQVVVTWDNSAAGDNNTGITSVTADLSGWGGSTTATMTDTTACSGTAGNNIYEACYTLVAGTIDTTNVNASVTATTSTGSNTTSDTSNRTVDNQPATVTASAISVTGATGTSGAFKSGDNPVGRWDNSAAGDNNTDTISSVSFNMANFKSGDTALTGSNSSNIWTTSLSGALDAQGDVNNNTIVTVTDNAGNQTVTSGTNNYTADTQLPTISSITSVAGDATAPYYDSTNDSSTAIVFSNSDTGTGVTTCKWDTSDVAYASMTNTCATTTSCTSNLTGDGAKTVYLACIDGAGNAMSTNTQVDYTIDATGPSGTTIVPASTRIITNAVPSFVVEDGTDSGSGINTATRLLERKEATYSNNTCGSFGSYSTVAYSGTYPNISDSTVTGSKCYQYRWSVSDNAANSSNATTSTLTRAPLTTLVITGGNNQSYGDDTHNPIGHALTTPLQVQVTDGGTNTALTDEVTVDFLITTIPGSPTAVGQSLSVASDNTDSSGYAETSLTLGDRAGNYIVQASSTGAVVNNVVDFTETEADYFVLSIDEPTIDIALDPQSDPTDFATPTVSFASNAASYEIHLTPDQWPSAGLYQILNWLTPRGFGWAVDNGAIMAFEENSGDPASTNVYECSGTTCQGSFLLDVDLHAGIDFTYPSGIYTTDVQYSGENISY